VRLVNLSTDVVRVSPLRTYLQLLRAPNVFTAFADVLVGYFVTHEVLEPSLALFALLAASGCLYLAGMVLNDVFDRDVDAIERPERPIPSGRVSLANAQRLGWGLLAGGVLLAAAACFLVRAESFTYWPIVVALALAALIVGYNALLKRTPLGPLAMGGCRAFNVLLGMSAAPLDAVSPMHLWIAGGLGIYVTGLTWCARDEAILSRRVQLSLAAVVMCLGMAALSQYPRWADDSLPELLVPRHALGDLVRWNALWVATAALVGNRLVRAILSPSPRNVQTAVKSSILTIVVLDAICAMGVHDVAAAGVILALLAPALLLGRWVYST
jgi:4-hydroxybenzoate polyprenyltransferase